MLEPELLEPVSITGSACLAVKGLKREFRGIKYTYIYIKLFLYVYSIV